MALAVRYRRWPGRGETSAARTAKGRPGHMEFIALVYAHMSEPLQR